MLNILTLSWNGADKLSKLYPSLIEALSGVEFKWLIKDNGSTDNSINYINELNNKNIIIIDYKHNNDNFAQGCNFLFKESNSNSEDMILLLNNDIVVKDPNSIKNMIKILNSDDSVGVVGARLLYEDSKTLQHAGVIFSALRNGLPFEYRRGEKDDNISTQNREFQAITGAVMLTKAKYYNNICKTNKSGMNGLDENFHWAFEDISGCLSIKYEMNKKVVYCGDTLFIHEGSATLKKNPVNKLYLHQNVIHFNSKWYRKYELDSDNYIKNPSHLLYKR